MPSVIIFFQRTLSSFLKLLEIIFFSFWEDNCYIHPSTLRLVSMEKKVPWEAAALGEETVCTTSLHVREKIIGWRG